jgi:hypothetical protein
MNLFDEEDKAYVSMTYRAHGKTHSVNIELDNDCTWDEVLDPIIRTLEAAYGYSFKLDSNKLGIYNPGKQND